MGQAKSGTYYSQTHPEMIEGLTDKQVMFIDEYLKCFSVRDASVKAGYGKGINHLYKNEKIAKEIARRMDELSNKKETIATQEEICEIMTSIARGEQQNYENKQVKKINETVERKEVKGSGTPSEEARLKALELLGKAHGLFVDRKQVEANIQQVEFVDDIGDDKDEGE